MRKSLMLMLMLLAWPLAHAGDARIFGAAMPPGEAEPIASAIMRLAERAATPRKFSGRVTEVCQAKGCWMLLEQDGQAARVMMKDHAFTLPKDARGAAIVHGTLTAKMLDDASARHLAADAGRSGAVSANEYQIEASSVELVGD